MSDNNSTFFLRISDEDVTRLLIFAKPKEKSKLFFNALLFYLLNYPEKEIMKFANPALKSEFEKTLKKIKKKYENEFELEKTSKKDKKNEEEEKKVEEIKKSKKREVKQDDEDFEEDEF